eukprot:676056-Pyramimonas_sp.AAC.1
MSSCLAANAFKPGCRVAASSSRNGEGCHQSEPAFLFRAACLPGREGAASFFCFFRGGSAV